MSDTLFPYYERELLYIRQFAQEFARQYPAAAGRLMLEPNRSSDPHIERLIEGFALIAGRIHRKLDDEFPELTDAMLGLLYPHYQRPVPSMALVEFPLDPTQADLPEGFLINKGTRLQTNPVGNLRCRFRTCYPVRLWPVKCTSARLQSPPFPPGVQAPPRTAGALRLQLECMGNLKFSDLSLERLRFYLSGSNHVIASLYELIFNHATRVQFRSLDDGDEDRQLILSPEETLRQVGFEADEGMLPYPDRSFLGYRLLTEFFTFPYKFLFAEIDGWRRVAQKGFGRKLEVVVFLDRTQTQLEPEIDEETFRLGATPIVNLFNQTAEPISLTHSRYEHRVLPDVHYPLGKEVYSIDSVLRTDPATQTTEKYLPFYALRHGTHRDKEQTFWYASRRPSARENDRATEVYLNLVDRGFNPRLPAESTLVIHTTCTNRNLPNQLRHAGEELYFELEAAAPIGRVRCLESPSVPLRPPLKRGAHWSLISHLTLNHLSLSDPLEGRDALKEILRLYDFSDPEAGQQQLAEVNEQIIEGITAVKTRRVVGRTGESGASGFARGIEVTVEFDEQKYVGTGKFLFASVLERFLGLYASINSFSQFVATTRQREGYFKKWPPRTGQQQLI